jgi:hypothetical protein
MFTCSSVTPRSSAIWTPLIRPACWIFEDCILQSLKILDVQLDAVWTLRGSVRCSSSRFSLDFIPVGARPKAGEELSRTLPAPKEVGRDCANETGLIISMA